jgi:S-formylglutathione hydrolase FrmB
VKRAALLLAIAAAAACAKASAPPPAPSAPAAPVAAVKGRVETRHFHSAALDVDKTYNVYLPAGYDATPARRWPVYYYLHGLGGDENNWLRGGHLDEQADQLGVAAIIVMPDGDDGFYVDSPRAIDYAACMRDGTGLFMPAAESKPRTCVKHHAYETYIVTDIVGDVDAHYRTIATREGRGIAGFSMGGFGALELAMRHPGTFAAAASHSGVDALLYGGPHPYVAGKVAQTDIAHWGAAAGAIGDWVRGIFGTDLALWQRYDPIALAGGLASGDPALYLDCGTEDGFALQDEASYLHDVLTARGIEHTFFLGPGGHDFGFWRARLPDSLKFMREHVAAAQH